MMDSFLLSVVVLQMLYFLVTGSFGCFPQARAIILVSSQYGAEWV